MCEEEQDDPDAVRKLLEINDSIHRTIERYRLVKKGDVDAASRIPKGTLGTTTGVSKNANNELSLIDFDPEPSSNGGDSQQQAQGESSLESDLLGLSMDEPVPSGGISLGPSKFVFTNNTKVYMLICQPIRRLSVCLSARQRPRHQFSRLQHPSSPTMIFCHR